MNHQTFAHQRDLNKFCILLMYKFKLFLICHFPVQLLLQHLRLHRSPRGVGGTPPPQRKTRPLRVMKKIYTRYNAFFEKFANFQCIFRYIYENFANFRCIFAFFGHFQRFLTPFFRSSTYPPYGIWIRSPPAPQRMNRFPR